MIDREAGGQEVGARLLHFSGMVFAWWRRLAAGSIGRTTLHGYVARQTPVVRQLLGSGRDGPCRWTAKVCRQLLAIEPSLWTLARREGLARTTTRRSVRCGTR